MMRKKKLLCILMMLSPAVFAKAAKRFLQLDTTSFNNERLKEMERKTKTSSDKGFYVWLSETKKVDQIMGKDYAEKRVTNIIMREDSNITAANQKAIEGIKIVGRLGDQVYYARLEKGVKEPNPP